MSISMRVAEVDEACAIALILLATVVVPIDVSIMGKFTLQ